MRHEQFLKWSFEYGKIKTVFIKGVMMMKRRILSLTVVFAMILTVIPTFTLTASAESLTVSGGGTGGVGDPYKIANLADLEVFCEYINTDEDGGSGEYFELTAPIDMSANYNAENGTSWTPIGTESNKFQGTFDGGKFTISGLYINAKEGHQGLFGDSYGTIKNLTVSGSVSGNGEVGGIVGENYGGSILNCRSDCAVSGSGNYVGGIAGYHTGTIKNCYNTGTVNGGTGGDNDYVGGIAGNNSGSIENCHNAGTIKGTGSYTGGVVGENKSSGSGSIKNCYNEGTVNGVSYTGGIAGNNDSAGVESCYNTGTVSGSDTIGGIVGSNTGSIKNCYYLNSCGAAGDYGTSKTEDAFNSGEVTWSLQNGQGTQAWGQKLGDSADKYPLLTSEESKKVLKVTFATKDNPNYDIQYINLNGKVTPPKNPEKDNYTFEKWAKTQEAEGEEFDTSTSVTEDMTVYAVGQEKFGGDSDEIPLSGIYGYEAPLTVNLDNYMKYANTDISSAGKFVYIIASDENETKADIVSNNTLSVPTGLKAGDYTIKIKAAEKMPQYSLMSVESYGTEDVTLTVKVSIAKADSIATVTAKDLTYTGSEQELVSGSAEGGTLQYATSQEGVYSEDIPTGINAQDYEVWYKVVGDSNHNNIDPTKVENVEIKKANSEITETPTAKDLTYDGTAQELVTAGEATGGEFQYSLDNVEYSTNIPKGTEAKTYTVYYKVVENENYNGIEETSISVEIKAQPEATPNIAIDYETEQLTGFESSATYQITGSDISNTVTSATTASAVEYMGKGELSIVRKARNDNYADSTAQSLTVPARLGEPSVEGAAPTTHDGKGKITGTDTTMEYREKTDGDTEEWQDCTEGEIEVEPDKTYEVRTKAVAESAFASEIKEVNVPKFEPTEITGTVTIEGDAIFGQQLTAVTTAVEPEGARGTLKYQWQRSNGGGYTDISGATESTYKITTEDIGKTIQVVVTADNPDYSGSLTSAPTGTVQKATISDVTVTANSSITAYTGEEQTLVTVSGNEDSDTIEYKVEKKGDGDAYEDFGTDNSATDAGTYKVTVTVKREGHNDYTSEGTEVTIAKANSTVTAPTAKQNLTYTGDELELLDDKGSANGGQLQYSLNNADYSTDIPKGTEAKTYTVYYKVVGNDNYNGIDEANIKVTIAKATPVFPTVEAVDGGTYEPEKKLSSVDVPDVDGGTLAWKNDETVLTAGENSVQAIFTPENSENYEPATIEGTVIVNVAKADSSVEAPTPKTDLTYNGTAQELLETAGSATGGQLQYKVDEGEYSTAAPTAATAGEHTVYYKVVENENYNGIDEANIKVNIAKATPVFPEVGDVDGGTYEPGKKLSDVTVPEVDGGTLAWSDGETALNAGANSVQAVFTPDNSENYDPETVTETVTVNVEKATITGVKVDNVLAQFDEAEPTKQYALAAPTGTLDGDTVSYAEGEYDADTDASASWQETCPSYSDEGTNQTITVRIERENYNNLYLKAIIKITNEPLITGVDVTANEGLVYNGGAQELVTVTGTSDSDTVTYYVNGDTVGTRTAQGTNAGDYSVRVKVERDGYHHFEKTVDVTIAKATPTFPTVDEVNGGTYEPGKKLGDVTVPEVQGGTLAWSDGETALNAGANSAQAVFTPSDKANYEDTTVTGTVTVNVAKATITDVEVQGVSVQFDETQPTKEYTLEAPTGTIEGDVVSYAEGEYNEVNDSEADWKDTCPSYSAENTNKTITVKIERANYNTLYLTATINIIGEPTIDDVDVTANEGLVYNGSAQELVTVTGALETDTVTYYVNDDTTGSTEKATGTNAGSYSVKVKVERADYHHFEKTVDVTIAKATPTFPEVAAVDGGIYAPDKKLGDVELPTVDGGTLAWSDENAVLTAGENSVQAVFTPSDTANYEDAVTGTITVNVANATITAADVVISGDGDITHDGAAHGLTVTLGGSAEGGAVKYIEGEYNADTDTELDWLDTCPTVTEVGDTKTITVKVSKENYDDYYTTKTITITDEPTVSDITVAPYGGTYDGASHNAVTVVGAESTDTIKYQLDGSETASVPQITDAGTYSVTVTVERAGYHPYTTTVEAAIAQAESTFPTVKAIDVTYTEGITLADVELPTVTDGTLSWADETISVTEGTNEYDAVFTPTDAVNYKTASGKITVTATAEVTPSPSPSPEPSTGFDVTGTVKNNDGTAAANRKITLKPLGLETTTDEDGNYAFNGVEAGSYNIVVETGDGKTVTTLVDVTDSSVSADITLPAANVGSAVETTDSDNNSDIKVEDIVVGGLDEFAEAVVEALPEADKTKNIEVKMIIESKKESSADMVQQAIKQQSKNKDEKLDYIDIDIIKIVGTESENVTETTNLITIIIPFVTDGKKDITVYRYHDGEAAAMTKGGIGERYEVEDGVITIYTQKFSTYAIAYNDRSTTPTPTPTPDTGGTSRGGSASYTVRFETNDGSDVASQRISRNGVVKEPTAPTKDGYTFAGWYTDKNLTAEYDFTSKVTGSFTLYAKWNEDKTNDETEATPAPTDEPQPTAKSMPFTDVNIGDWFYNDVQYVYENGLMNGVSGTEFAPNETITRGMFVTILYRMDGEPSTGASAFTDVPSGAYYANAVAWASVNGIVKGYSDTEYAPDDAVTREQAAAILFRYAAYKGESPTGAWVIQLGYTDLSDISDWAAEGVMFCNMKNIMAGRDSGEFDPQSDITRAEGAAVFERYLNMAE